MKWIPCSERLPEKDGSYLVDLGFRMEVIYFVDGWNTFKDYAGKVHRESEIHGVKAWMPLPEPYEEDTEETEEPEQERTEEDIKAEKADLEYLDYIDSKFDNDN